MRRSVATVSMSGTLRQKLEAIAAARFDAIELFENDFINFNGSAGELRAMAADLGLGIDLYQPFRDFEGMPDAAFARSLDRAERKFDLMEALGAPLMLVCSNTSPLAIDDPARSAAQLHALAERAARRNLRIGYEALAWGRFVNLYRQAWDIVERADHPHLGLVLDSFHTLSLQDDPTGIAELPGERIFFLQMADAPLLAMDVLQWARHHRNFPGQGQFDVESFFHRVLLSGYAGPLSLEIFNDQFRETPNRRTAVDAMRSLLYLESRVRDRLEAARSAAPTSTAARGGGAHARAHRALRSARRAGARGLRLPRIRARRRGGRRPRRAAAATRLRPHRPASHQGSHAVSSRRHPARDQRRPGGAGAGPLRCARTFGLRYRPGDTRPDAGGQPRQRPPFGAPRKPAWRGSAAVAGDRRAGRNDRPLRALGRRRRTGRRFRRRRRRRREVHRTPAWRRSITSPSAWPPTSSTPGPCSAAPCSAWSAARASSSPIRSA